MTCGFIESFVYNPIELYRFDWCYREFGISETVFAKALVNANEQWLPEYIKTHYCIMEKFKSTRSFLSLCLVKVLDVIQAETLRGDKRAFSVIGVLYYRTLSRLIRRYTALHAYISPDRIPLFEHIRDAQIMRQCFLDSTGGTSRRCQFVRGSS